MTFMRFMHEHIHSAWFLFEKLGSAKFVQIENARFSWGDAWEILRSRAFPPGRDFQLDSRRERDFRDAELKTPVMCHVKNTSTWDVDGREGPQVIKNKPRGATPNPNRLGRAAVTSTYGTDGAADRPYDRARTAVALSPLAVLVPVHLFSYMCYYTKNYDVN